MNVTQLGTGSTDVRFFVLTAVAAGLLSLCLAFGLRPWERAVERRKERFAEELRIHTSDLTLGDLIRQTTFVQRIFYAFDPTDKELKLHRKFMLWAGLPLRWFKRWATTSWRQHRDNNTIHQGSHELTPGA